MNRKFIIAVLSLVLPLCLIGYTIYYFPYMTSPCLIVLDIHPVLNVILVGLGMYFGEICYLLYFAGELLQASKKCKVLLIVSTMLTFVSVIVFGSMISAVPLINWKTICKLTHLSKCTKSNVMRLIRESPRIYVPLMGEVIKLVNCSASS